MAVAEVRRSKALALILESAEIVDTNGEVIDISQLNPDRVEDLVDEAEVEAEAEVDAEIEEEADDADTK